MITQSEEEVKSKRAKKGGRWRNKSPDSADWIQLRLRQTNEMRIQIDIKHIYAEEAQDRQQITDHPGIFVHYLLNESEPPGSVLPQNSETNQHSVVSIRA